MSQLRPHLSPSPRSKCLSFRIQLPITPTFLLQLTPHSPRIVLPRKNNNQPQAVRQRTKNHFQSAHVSRNKIEFEDKGELQFSRRLPQRPQARHTRTQSNRIDQYPLGPTELSDFSNSLENLSREIIEIPFANKVITPLKHPNTPHSPQHPNPTPKRNPSFSQQSEGDSTKNSSMHKKLNFQRNSTEKKQSKQNIRGHSRKGSKESRDWVPRPKRNTMAAGLQLSEFSLKALKITAKNSIIYLAMHKITGSLFALKSVKKATVRHNLSEFLLELKLGLLLNHPNIVKTYAFFSDCDNFYILKEYLEEGSLIDYPALHSETHLAVTINQILLPVIYLLPIVDTRFWYITASALARTYGICKITNFGFTLTSQMDIFSDQLRETLLWLFQNEDYRQNNSPNEWGLETADSIIYQTKVQSSPHLQSFQMILQNTLLLTDHTLHTLWQHDFLAHWRFKALMQQ